MKHNVIENLMNYYAPVKDREAEKKKAPGRQTNSFDRSKLTITAIDEKDIGNLHRLLGEPVQMQHLQRMRTAKLIQVIYHKRQWSAILAWTTAKPSNPERDKWAGWPDGLNTHARKVVARNLFFTFNPCQSGKEADKAYLMSAAMSNLTYAWMNRFQCRPLLAETRRSTMLYDKAYKDAGWFSISANPNDRKAWWLYELDRFARYELGMHQLNAMSVNMRGRPQKGTLPLRTHMLASMRDALQEVCVPAGVSTHYNAGGVLALAFLSAICGKKSATAVTDFAQRLEPEQSTQILGSNHVSNYNFNQDLSGACRHVDIGRVIKILEQWLTLHLDEVPPTLHPMQPFMRRAFRDFAVLLEQGKPCLSE